MATSTTTSPSEPFIEHFVRDKDAVYLRKFFPNEEWSMILLLSAKGPQFFWEQQTQQQVRHEKRLIKELEKSLLLDPFDD